MCPPMAAVQWGVGVTVRVMVMAHGALKTKRVSGHRINMGAVEDRGLVNTHTHTHTHTHGREREGERERERERERET